MFLTFCAQQFSLHHVLNDSSCFFCGEKKRKKYIFCISAMRMSKKNCCFFLCEWKSFNAHYFRKTRLVFNLDLLTFEKQHEDGFSSKDAGSVVSVWSCACDVLWCWFFGAPNMLLRCLCLPPPAKFENRLREWRTIG